MTTIYSQLKAIAQTNPHLLTSFRTDLTNHDLATLKKTKAGEEWLWILRDTGTELYPMPQSVDEGTLIDSFKQMTCYYAGVTYSMCSSEPHPYKFFHVKIEKPQHGTVEEITPVQALEMMKPLAMINQIIWEQAGKDVDRGELFIPYGFEDYYLKDFYQEGDLLDHNLNQSLADYYKAAYSEEVRKFCTRKLENTSLAIAQ